MHSGKLNRVQFSFSLCTELLTTCNIRRRNWQSSQVLYNWGTLWWISQSITGRKLVTSCCDWRRSWLSRTCDVAGHCSSLPVQCTSEKWTQLNGTIQFSSVFCCALSLTCYQIRKH